jgi:Ca2+-binding EF-hand superfamily protein
MEFFDWLNLDRTAFAEKAFSVMDEDNSGDIDFKEFVCCVWNYCSFGKSALVIFAFDLYDLDKSGCIGREEMENIVYEIYGAGYDHSKQAQGVIKKLVSWRKYARRSCEEIATLLS